MKIIKLESKESTKDYSDEILEAVHRCAEANGSTCRLIDLVCEPVEKGYQVICKKSHVNRLYTEGYFAVLYLVDCSGMDLKFYTCPGKDGNWFNIYVTDPQEFIKYLTD